MKNVIANLESHCCTYWEWKLSGILCSHDMEVFKELRYQHCNIWVSSYITMEKYRSPYIEIMFHMPVPAEYEQSNEVMVELPSLIEKQKPKDHEAINISHPMVKA